MRSLNAAAPWAAECRNLVSMVTVSMTIFRNGLETEERKEGVVWAEYKSLPRGEMGTVITAGPKQVGPKLD